MSEYITFPDATAWAVGVLKDAGNQHVYSSLPKAPTFPLIVVQRIGGVPREKHALDQARLQVSVWGRTLTEAHNTAQAARVALHAAESDTVTDVSDDLGLAFLRDPETGRDRYLFGVSVTMTAAA